jgi:NDP-sugar pyrophosphorylase family protein
MARVSSGSLEATMRGKRVTPKPNGKPGRSAARGGGRKAPDAEGASYSAHASAVIDPGVAIGAGTRIWHWSHVMTGARIGRGCSPGQNVFVGAGVVIRDRVKIQSNVSVLLVMNTTRREAGGTAVMRRVWAVRPPRCKIGRLMLASCVDLPAHLCPNWARRHSTTNGALPNKR